MTESKKAAAISIASVEDNNGTRWTIFENWSTTTRILVLPPFSGRFIKEVHHQVLPWYASSWYQLKLPSGCNVLHLGMLAHITLMDVCFHFFPHSWEPILLGKMMESLVDAQVSHVVMIFLYNLHLHGGWQHHPIPIGQCLVQHSITKMIMGIHPLCKAFAVAGGRGWFPAVP